MVATGIVDLPLEASAGPLTPLQAPVARTGTALHHIDPAGADGKAVDLLAQGHDAPCASKLDVSAFLHERGSDPAARVGFVEGPRDVLGRARPQGDGRGDGTPPLDRLRDTIDALADPGGAATLERHRTRMVSLVNRSQDGLDG